jgi:hypothetical protein
MKLEAIGNSEFFDGNMDEWWHSVTDQVLA